MSVMYRGVGGVPAPSAKFVDELISERLSARGLIGRRGGDDSVYATRDLSQALEYSKTGDEQSVLVVTPLPGAILSWCPDVRDFLLGFERHLRDLFWDGSDDEVIVDSQGSIEVIDTYLSFQRERETISAIIDGYLREISIMEVVVTEFFDLDEVLGSHRGEVWITGPVLSEKMSREDEQSPSP